MYEIELDILENHVSNLQTQLTRTIDQLSNSSYSLFKSQIQYIYYKLNKIRLQLGTFEPNLRAKRGLINPLGTIIKSITGNLDYEDALRFENALITLRKMIT